MNPKDVIEGVIEGVIELKPWTWAVGRREAQYSIEFETNEDFERGCAMIDFCTKYEKESFELFINGSNRIRERKIEQWNCSLTLKPGCGAQEKNRLQQSKL